MRLPSYFYFVSKPAWCVAGLYAALACWLLHGGYYLKGAAADGSMFVLPFTYWPASALGELLLDPRSWAEYAASALIFGIPWYYYLTKTIHWLIFSFRNRKNYNDADEEFEELETDEE